MEHKVLNTRAPRAELMRLLDGHLDRRVIFIHAPAGFGKTVSAQLWLSHRGKLAGIKHKTVTFDEYDNNAAEFCRRFVSALASLQPDNNRLRALMEETAFASAPVEFALRSLGLITEGRQRHFLVFDDLHMITNHEVLRLQPIFINRLPQNFTVLLLSRRAPSDIFAEMEAKGELIVVDSSRLQFTDDEIQAFFHDNGSYITKKQADDILKSTGGWAIGIRSLLLSNERSYDIKLTGRHLERFLRKHIWEQWTDRQRRFMTLVCVAEELTAQLCRRLIADEDSLKAVSCDELLTELANEKAYLRQTGQGTYRFHDLFREFLVRMLRKHGEGLLHRQLSKAGDYYFGQRDYHRAAEYYKKGANDEGVINSVNKLYDYNCVGASIKDTLSTVRFVINDATLEKDPFMFETLIWSAFVEGRADEFEGYADKYYRLYPTIASQDSRSGAIFAFLFCIDYRLSLARAFETICGFAQNADERAASPTLTHNMPFFHRSNRDFSEVLCDTEKNMQSARNSIGRLIGKEYAVLQECLFSGFYYERGLTNEAYEYALAACANITFDSSPEVRFCAMMMLAAVLAAADNKAELAEVLGGIGRMIEQKSAYYLNANLYAFKCRLRLADGDEAAAREWLTGGVRDLFDNLSFFELYQHFTTARAYITVENYTDAVLILRKLLALGERYRRPLDTIEAHILLSIVYWKKRQAGQSAALWHIRQAVSIASEYGYTQIFENEGAELVNILHRLQRSMAQKTAADEASRIFVRSVYIAAATGARRHKGLTGGKIPESMAFTDKQKTVMRLMSEGLDRNGIAARMDIKPYTVKSHIELIYRKLDVSNRTDAIIKINRYYKNMI